MYRKKTKAEGRITTSYFIYSIATQEIITFCDKEMGKWLLTTLTSQVGELALGWRLRQWKWQGAAYHADDHFVFPHSTNELKPSA